MICSTRVGIALLCLGDCTRQAVGVLDPLDRQKVACAGLGGVGREGRLALRLRRNSIMSQCSLLPCVSTGPPTLINCVGPDQFVAMTGTSMAIASKEGYRPLNVVFAPPTCPFPHTAPEPKPDLPSMSGLHQPSPCVASTNASAATSICWYLEIKRSLWRM